MSFEGEEDLNVEFGDIVPCDCSEGSYGHINALVDGDCCSRFAFGNSFQRMCHLEDSEGESLEQRILEGGRVNGSAV